MKKGFINFEHLICIVLLTASVFTIYETYTVKLRFDETYKKSFEEIQWEKENILSQNLKCVLKME
ncbi:MAG: hypothetical protein MR601_08460 [Erysipelotrichaceae bacterium]|nr:hypothetical protein [Erysipelotrichaceae bacterium]